jgi:hypothetical protein
MSKKPVESVVLEFDIDCSAMELIKKLRAIHANFGDVNVATTDSGGNGVRLVITPTSKLSKEKLKLLKKLGDKPW